MKYAAILLIVSGALQAGGAHARQCGDGRIAGVPDALAEPSNNMECNLWGRAFCRAAENRDLGMEALEAAEDVNNYLRQRMKPTGSHRGTDWSPLARQATIFAFQRPELVPGTIYYYSIYSCGTIKHAGQLDPEAASTASGVFEQAAADCMNQNPPEGLGFPNSSLRECLRSGFSQAFDVVE